LCCFRTRVCLGKLLDFFRKSAPLTHTRSAEKKEQAAFVFEQQMRIVLTRTARQLWMLEDRSPEALADATLRLLRDELTSRSRREKCAGGNRGPHFPCIIGHQRQYKKVRPFSSTRPSALTPTSLRS
jgi:hypothetical protein